MRKLLLTIMLFTSLLVGGCGYMAPVVPPQGLLFSSVQAPLDVNADETRFVSQAKTGEASTIAILGLFAFGDASLETAAANGGLSTVNHVDYAYLNVLFVFQQFTIIAHGE